MITINLRHAAVLLVHALILWAVCFAIMGIGMQVTTQDITLAAHLVAAPIVTALLTFMYFRYFHYTTPLQTALVFLVFIMLMDFIVVAGLILKSYEMFMSIEGTWLPFALIFVSSYLTGLGVRRALPPSVHAV